MKKLIRRLDGLKGPRVLLITCYKQSYSDGSLHKIKAIVEEKKPDSIIILKLIKENRCSEILEANIGFSDLENFKKVIKNLKKEDVEEFSGQLIKTIDTMDIPYEVHLRVGEMLSKEILSEYERLNVIHLIMHKPSTSYFERLIDSSTEEKVSKVIGKNNITTLD